MNAEELFPELARQKQEKVKHDAVISQQLLYECLNGIELLAAIAHRPSIAREYAEKNLSDAGRILSFAAALDPYEGEMK